MFSKTTPTGRTIPELPMAWVHVEMVEKPPERLTKRQEAERKAAIRMEQMTQKSLKEAEEMKLNEEI